MLTGFSELSYSTSDFAGGAAGPAKGGKPDVIRSFGAVNGFILHRYLSLGTHYANLPPMEPQQPNLFVDFVLEEAGLYLRLGNASPHEAHRVTVDFSQPVLGYQRSRDLARLNLFRRLAYIAPYKEFTVYIDEVSRFLTTLSENTIRVVMRYQDAEQQLFKKEIVHDLSIYQDLPIMLKS